MQNIHGLGRVLLKIVLPGVQVSCLIVNVFHGGMPGSEHAVDVLRASYSWPWSYARVQAYKNALLKIVSPDVHVSCLIVDVFHGGMRGREHAVDVLCGRHS